MGFSQKFLENATLLLLTAGLSGVLVPLLFRWIDERRHRLQKLLEAEIARQAKIIDAQVDLIEDLSTLLWEFQLLLIAVPYYRQFKVRDLYTPALNAYHERAGEILGRIRAEISKSLRLVPQPMFQRIKAFYYDELLRIDMKLTSLADRSTLYKQNVELSEFQRSIVNTSSELDDEAWSELHRFAVHELSEHVDQLIDDLAKAIELKSAEPK